MRNLLTSLILLFSLMLLTAFTPKIAWAANYSCQVESDFRIRDSNNINEVINTRLSGNQVCVGEVVTRRFKKANGSFGTDSFRQVRLENDQLGWISAKGVSAGALLNSSASAPIPMQQSARIANLRNAQVTPNTASATPKPVATVEEYSGSIFSIEEGFRIRSSPTDSNTNNVIASTTGANNLQPIYTNGALEIENGYVKTQYGNREVWVHETAFASAAMPQIPVFNMPRATPIATSSIAPTPAIRSGNPEPVRATTQEILAGLPQVDPKLQQAVEQLAQRNALLESQKRNEALLARLPQVDPKLQQELLVQQTHESIKANPTSPQLQTQLEQYLQRQNRPDTQTLIADLPPIDSNLQNALDAKAEAMKPLITNGASLNQASIQTDNHQVASIPQSRIAEPGPLIDAVPTQAITQAVPANNSVNNFLSQLSDRNFAKIRGGSFELFDSPGGSTPSAELKSGARFAIIKTVWLNPNDPLKKEAWFKLVPFDCQKLTSLGDPNMAPEDPCNQAYYIKFKGNNLSWPGRPSSEELAARPTPESYTEAAGYCENCNLSPTETMGNEIQAHAN